jgi:hypothetical protein
MSQQVVIIRMESFLVKVQYAWIIVASIMHKYAAEVSHPISLSSRVYFDLLLLNSDAGPVHPAFPVLLMTSISCIFSSFVFWSAFLISSHLPIASLSMMFQSRIPVFGLALLAAAAQAQQIVNGQIYTPGIAIVDAPQPNTPLGGGKYLHFTHESQSSC